MGPLGRGEELTKWEMGIPPCATSSLKPKYVKKIEEKEEKNPTLSRIIYIVFNCLVTIVFQRCDKIELSKDLDNLP
jgi:hypothetical protein